MAEFFDYFKVIMDYLKTNKWLLLWVFAGFSGAGYQTYEVSATEKKKNKAIHEVAVAFQNMPPEPTKTKVETKVIISKPAQCTKCLEAVEALRKEFH